MAGNHHLNTSIVNGPCSGEKSWDSFPCVQLYFVENVLDHAANVGVTLLFHIPPSPYQKVVYLPSSRNAPSPYACFNTMKRKVKLLYTFCPCVL